MKPSIFCYILSGGFLGAALALGTLNPGPIVLAGFAAVIAITLEANEL